MLLHKELHEVMGWQGPMTARQFDAWCHYNEWIKDCEVIWRHKHLTKDEAAKESMGKWIPALESAGVPVQNRELAGLMTEPPKPPNEPERIKHT